MAERKIMKYTKFTYSEKVRDYVSAEISEDQAFDLLSTLYIDTDCLRGKAFRLKTPYGYIEAHTSDGMVPAPSFYGICE